MSHSSGAALALRKAILAGADVDLAPDVVTTVLEQLEAREYHVHRHVTPIVEHRYDAGFPRDDSAGCIAVDGGGTVCGQPANAHRYSEYTH